jgi:endonuclease III
VIKPPFDIAIAIQRMRTAVSPFPKAAMFELFEEGYRTPFEQLVACMISIRTYDEVTIRLAHQLFTRARTPAEVTALPIPEIARLIDGSSFSARKAGQIWHLARQVLEQYDGDLPCDETVLLSLEGVGVKCAHLALGVACGQRWISVDVHVHRVANRWGYVDTRTPEKTMEELEIVLPEAYWVEINRLLVPFGKHICTRELPHCSTCPLAEMCPRIGVSAYR